MEKIVWWERGGSRQVRVGWEWGGSRQVGLERSERRLGKVESG